MSGTSSRESERPREIKNTQEVSWRFQRGAAWRRIRGITNVTKINVKQKVEILRVLFGSLLPFSNMFRAARPLP